MSDISITSSSSSEMSSDEDEQLLNVLININMQRNKRPKNEGYVEETVPQYSDEVLKEHFRVSRLVFNNLVEKYKNSEYFDADANGGNRKLTSEQHVLVFLWFAGHQTASFRDVADRFNITISSLFRITTRMISFLSNMSGDVIKWPNNQKMEEIQQHFTENGFPGVCGVIDGTHIKIDKPTEDPDSYLNRKHFYSVHAQVVCDHEKRIIDVFIGYPGSVHDSRVFRVSPLSAELPEKCGLNKYILGDSGYPCTRHLLTPFRDRGQLTAIQTHFNMTLSKNRYIIEHCFGLLKQKFRQLYHLKLRDITRVSHFIRACCVFHNLSINDMFEYENEGIGNNDNPPPHIEGPLVDEHEDDQDGIEIRNRKINLSTLEDNFAK